MSTPAEQQDQETTVEQLAQDISELVHSGKNETALTKAVADRLHTALAIGITLPIGATQAHPEHYVMYPLHVAEDQSFSIASAIWNVGQETPVHGHETWGVVGIYSGAEDELRYLKPTEPDVPLIQDSHHRWEPGQVTVCCTTDDDVHKVSCGSNTPCVGIHIYGDDIGTLQRRKYDPATGDVDWFVSTWEAVPTSPR